jgi:hypothetical protein
MAMQFDKDRFLKSHRSLKPDLDPGGILKTGKSAAMREQKRQADAIARQQQREELRLLESKSEVGERKSMRGNVNMGRRSLVQTSPTGAATLGGG